MAKKDNTIWVKLENIPRWASFSLVIILMCAALIHPIGIPVAIDAQTKQFYNTIANLPNGCVVLVNISMDPAAASELNPGMVVLLHQLFQKDIKILFYPSYTSVYPNIYTLYVEQKFDPTKYGKVYGVDYMAYGYVPGEDVAMVKLAQDLLFPVVDIKGNSLQSLPIMKNLKDFHDISMVIDIESSDVLPWIRTWGQAYGVPIAAIIMSMMMPNVTPYYSAGQIKALISGATGSPQYELLMGMPGDGLKNTDALSLVQLEVIGLVILGNIGYVMRRRVE